MARPDTLPKILTEAETDRLLAQPNQRYFGPCRWPFPYGRKTLFARAVA